MDCHADPRFYRQSLVGKLWKHQIYNGLKFLALHKRCGYYSYTLASSLKSCSDRERENLRCLFIVVKLHVSILLLMMVGSLHMCGVCIIHIIGIYMCTACIWDIWLVLTIFYLFIPTVLHAKMMDLPVSNKLKL